MKIDPMFTKVKPADLNRHQLDRFVDSLETRAWQYGAFDMMIVRDPGVPGGYSIVTEYREDLYKAAVNDTLTEFDMSDESFPVDRARGITNRYMKYLSKFFHRK